MLRTACLAALLPVLACLPAHAQGVGSGGIAGSGFAPPVQGTGPKSNRPEQAPPGLPGARPADAAAPALIPLDVPPTEALFDAINRGDLAAARDALNRGADLNGRNVLGMTPIDLSIDLSRNDITFLLLSLRGEAAVSGPPPNAAEAAVPRSGKKITAARLAPRHGATSPVATASAVVAVSAPAVRYASVPATPDPSRGFLGFGSAATP
jgi:hypothetical protein